ncbi:glutathione S-transferase N-terminal domain-containing protein [Peptoniphilus equinus]|uniref:Glutathione S-transferase N-terminal domain-containing protein n=1 Tax=Peptoniphilus equinus TaxID=3016343 RepID=A0ABY7QTX6_9FIRM|nr:glutathione S-transferase N-terminal domain-containing protein [Peptoniphilus equinus]WBW49613.1 glutathione S-transferase N-terminal domain-containing protein [Peptoniphilus equinus]
MENYKLYVGTHCPFCKKVESFIDEKGIEGVEIINVDENPDLRDALVEKGGKRQVPALEADGSILYESMDIIAYLNEHKGA